MGDAVGEARGIGKDCIMTYTEIVQERGYWDSYQEIINKYPRISEVVECAEWMIGRDHERFPSVEETMEMSLRVWRSDDSDSEDLPTVEIAYYYSYKDARIHFLGIRTVGSST